MDHQHNDKVALHICLASAASDINPAASLQIPKDLCEKFAADGFVVFSNVLSPSDVDALNDRLEHILRGRYDRKTPPDKTPRLIKTGYQHSGQFLFQERQKNTKKPQNVNINPLQQQCPTKSHGKGNPSTAAKAPLGFSGNAQNTRVLQVINVHKADRLFRRLATDPQLGCVVATLAGWKDGARLAQDQVWAKPPGAPPLTFHRDSPYFMFTPDDVVTVWVALDDMDAPLGPLEYVKGSHLWNTGRVGSSNQFFEPSGGKNLVRSAAAQQGISEVELDDLFVNLAGLAGGGISIHHGKTWHGSGRNSTQNKPRRGLGLHFVPANVRFTAQALHSKLWNPFLMGLTDDEDVSSIELRQEDFPVTWIPPR